MPSRHNQTIEERGHMAEKKSSCLKWVGGCAVLTVLLLAAGAGFIAMNWERIKNSEFGTLIGKASESMGVTIEIMSRLKAEFPESEFNLNLNLGTDLELTVTNPSSKLFMAYSPSELAATTYSMWEQTDMEVFTMTVNFQGTSQAATNAGVAMGKHTFTIKELKEKHPEAFGLPAEESTEAGTSSEAAAVPSEAGSQDDAPEDDSQEDQ